jgi:hypothetical protein
LTSDSNSNSISYSDVVISGTTIRKIANGIPVLTIPKVDILQVRLSHDTEASNPFGQYLLGITLLILGLLGLGVTFLALAGGGGVATAKPGEMVVPLVPIVLWIMTGAGFWLLVGIFRARYNLCIDTESGVSRVFFGKGAEVMALRQFIWRANLKFGYEIDSTILDKTCSPG